MPVTLVSNGGGGFVDAAVDMGLGGKVDDGVAAGHGGFDGVGVADVASDEAVARILGDGCEIGEIPSVGQLVVVDDGVLLAGSQNHDG